MDVKMVGEFLLSLSCGICTTLIMECYFEFLRIIFNDDEAL